MHAYRVAIASEKSEMELKSAFSEYTMNDFCN